jgi:ElaB/YqjD/DUF883 family membrane-anchored ribosome-binding protein
MNAKGTAMPANTKGPGLTNSVGTMIDNTAAEAHGAVEYASGAAGEALDRARPLLDNATNMAHLAVETAAEQVARPAQWLAEQGQDLQARQQKLANDARGYVVANPVKSLAIALVAGIVLGRLVL